MITKITSDSGNEYTINTEELTCDCPNWRYRCHNFGKSDDRRLCKHLIAYFNDHPELKPISLIQKDKLLDAATEINSRPKQLRVMFDAFVSEINSALKQFSDVVDKFEVCDEYRRLCSKISDLHYVVSLKPDKNFDSVIQYFTNILTYNLTRTLEDKTYVFNIYGLAELTVHIVSPKSWVLSLIHYTGDKTELLNLRNRANQLGYTLTSSELIVNSTNRPKDIIFESEQQFYEFLQLPYKQPWLRTNE